MAKTRELVKKSQALRMAQEMGCTGAHKDKDGNWLPCSSPEEMDRRSNVAETSKWRTVVPGYEPNAKGMDKTRSKKGRRKRRRSDWEKLRERPTGGFEHIDGAGIVSADIMAPVGSSGPEIGGSAPAIAMTKAEVMARIGPEYVRESDPDVYVDPDSAREKAKRLGCIGISRRISKNGRAVWMPCTNMSDYANRTGSTALGRRNMERQQRREMQRAVRTVLGGKKTPLKKKSLITEEIIHTRFTI